MENNRIVDFSKTSLHDIYGENCFNDAIMRELLPKAVYKELKEVQQGNKELTLETALLFILFFRPDQCIQDLLLHRQSLPALVKSCKFSDKCSGI